MRLMSGVSVALCGVAQLELHSTLGSVARVTARSVAQINDSGDVER